MHINWTKGDYIINSREDLLKCSYIKFELIKKGYSITHDDYEMNGDHIQVFTKGDHSISFNELAV
ncbi:hypothetical protein [Shouchella patagoniensis]|uniref:hypothetical protein n=1 Tax=Shouchella patagoniensis TaxID=228576 RepID=UPI00099594AF|nr:hypothetical protein [Shouchella patagoniensis]